MELVQRKGGTECKWQSEGQTGPQDPQDRVLLEGSVMVAPEGKIRARVEQN